ncbi:MAG: RICIN domain-containing protein [Candidatus Saccharibacteria bacterium]|nr:RICIN domain-containing protein [Candidatus Saccharibacteria bacterium]
MVRRRDKRIWWMLLGAFILVFGITFVSQKINDRDTEAANMGAFDPGYIISDYQMTNYASMSESDIQNFLKSKNSCNDRDLNKYTYGNKVGYFSESTPYTWHVKDGHFVCMAEENFNGESAAHIIWQAAQDFKINPKVILVILQKEQGLVTDTFPHSIQYRSAMGYGCPDTAPCSPKYAGFKNQVRSAAEMLREVMDGGWSNYPVGENYIKYSPNCSSGSWVNVRNRATSALYRYTSYQPNRAVLNGGSDSCSAYGNSNFYRYFEDWFGGITAIQKNARIADGTYYILSSAAKTMAIDVDSGMSKNGTNIQLYRRNNSNAQQWVISYNSSTDDYNIINAASKKALDVDGANIKRGTNIQLWDSNKTCAQRWKIVETSGEVVKFISACSNAALDVSSGNLVNGGNIQTWDDNNTKAQKWILVPVETVPDGLYNITSAKSDKTAIDISGGSHNARNGSNVQIYRNNYTAAQRWYIEKDNNDYYTIKNKQSGKVLDVEGASVKSTANVRVYTGNNTCAQKWRILKSGDNYTFISACSHKVLDLAGGSIDNGTNIRIYTPNNTVAQKWNFSEVPIVESGTYSVVSGLNENKAVDIANGSKYNGANIQLYNDNGTDAQKWEISYDDKTDTYKLFNKTANKAIDVDSASRESGANVQIYSSNNTCAQKWSIIKTGDKYKIYSTCSGLALDVYGASTKNGANIWLYRDNGTDAQKWMLKQL